MTAIIGMFFAWAPSAFAASGFDAGASAIMGELNQEKGLLVRVPVTESGENTSLAEARIDRGDAKLDSSEALVQAFERGTSIKGFGELSKPADVSGSGASTCYYCGYSPMLWWGNYYWYYYRPVYYYRVYYYTVTYVYYYYPFNYYRYW